MSSATSNPTASTADKSHYDGDVTNANIRERKQILRKKVRSGLKALTREELVNQSTRVWDRLFNLPAYQSAKSVGLFLSMPTGEIITDEALAHVLDNGKDLYVPHVGTNFEKCDMELLKAHVDPVTEEKITHSKAAARRLFYHDWPRNKWGIPEPPKTLRFDTAQPGDIDLLVVPGLAFDRYGGRLGQGKGYYDRFIARMREKGSEDGTDSTAKPLLVAVGLEPQFVDGETEKDRVPMTEHDFVMDMLVLPSRTIEFSPQGKG